MAQNKRSVASALSEIDKRLDANELLDAETRDRIKQKAREHVANKRRDEAESKLLAQEIRREEIAYNPLEQFENVEIDLAPYVPYISLDGAMYFHGVTYNVPYSAARTIDDISARTWEHDNEIHGRRRRADITRKPRLLTIQPGSEGVPSSALNTRASVMRPDTEI